MGRLFRQFFPGGIPSHAVPQTPGSIHEGGELGYSLAHTYGAALDNPSLVVCCVVGSGETETGPLATTWHSNKFLNPITDGAALPILHVNGYTRSPTRRSWPASATTSCAGWEEYGYYPIVVSNDDPADISTCAASWRPPWTPPEIADAQRAWRLSGSGERPRWVR